MSDKTNKKMGISKKLYPIFIVCGADGTLNVKKLKSIKRRFCIEPN
jgi:hypothetical protein